MYVKYLYCRLSFLCENSLVKMDFVLTLSELSNYSGLFHSLFWIELNGSVGVKGLILTHQDVKKSTTFYRC